ncbi:hypothetical protein [Lactococcus allomyrinae]|nr:hypothetical protein [Lactococcus allomyrinae]
MPWEFYKERQGFSIEKVLLSSMPIIFYSIGILLPIEHFKNYLTDIRIFEIIRQHKSRYRYGYFVVFSLTYIFSYMALNVILMWFLGYRGSFGSGIGQAGLVMGVLLSIVALFSLFDSWSLGNVVALIILIVYSGFTFPERKEICFLGILFVALGFINHLIYLRREIY